MALPVDPGSLFGAGMVLVGGLVLLVSLRYCWRTGAVLRAPRRASLAAVAPGAAVQVTGTVVATDDRAVATPFNGRDCVARRASVEERRLSPVALPWFVTVWEDERAVPFGLRTPEDEVSVANPIHTVVLAADDVTTVGFDERPPDRIERFESAADDLPARTVWTDPPRPLGPLWRLLSLGTRRYAEHVLAAGDEVTVVGRRQDDGGMAAVVVSDRSPRRTFLRMVRTSLGGLAIGAFAVLLGVALLLV